MKVLIIGAGASGLSLASILSKYNVDITIYKGNKIGSKILASGNGKCNLGNINVSKTNYFSSPFYDLILPYKDELYSHFTNIKIFTKADSQGRIYPYSESSKSVLDALLASINAKFIDEYVININKINNKYYINNDSKIGYDKVVVSCGSLASITDKNIKNGNNFDFLNFLKLKINDFKPGLVGFKVKNNIKHLSGTRAKVNASLVTNNKLIHSEDGEIIFKDDGISGICIMNLSSYYQHQNNNSNSKIILDFAKNIDFSDYRCILSPKLYLDYQKNKFDIHKYELDILSTYNIEMAQIGIGGIDISEFNCDLSLKKDKNIYICGELLDIDGVCGGYNLMSSFTSGYVVSRGILNEISFRKS